MLHTICDGARIAYDVTGRGPALMLLHSTASSSTQWSDLRSAFAGDWTVVTIDLYGHGESDPWHGRRPLTLADEAAAVAAVLAPIEGPVHLVGQSYGGAVALNLALSGRPLASLTLVEPVAFHLLREDAPMLLAEIAAVAGAVRDGLAAGDAAAAMAGFVDYWNGPGAWAAIRADRQSALAALAPAVAMHFAAAMGDPARLTDCSRLAVPTFVLSGDRTTPPAAAIAARLAATIPGARACIMAGAGHMLPRTHSDRFLRALAAHLDRVTTGEAEARLLSVA